jgi:hypothetical protein
MMVVPQKTEVGRLFPLKILLIAELEVLRQQSWMIMVV